MRRLLLIVCFLFVVACTPIKPKFNTDISSAESLNANVGIYYDDGAAGYGIDGLLKDKTGNPIVFKDESLEYLIFIFQPGTDAFTEYVYKEEGIVHSYDELGKSRKIPFSTMNIPTDSDRRFDVLLQVELPSGKVLTDISYAYELPSFN